MTAATDARSAVGACEDVFNKTTLSQEQAMISNSMMYRPQIGYQPSIIGNHFPFPSYGGEYNQTLPGSYTGNSGWLGGGLLTQFSQDRGYAIDYNQNGRYDRRNDGVLMFDLNGDGKYNKKDVRQTNQMMEAVAGNYDFNRDGKVTLGEKMRGAGLRAKYSQFDTNRDGRLSTEEMSRGGARVWMDKDGDGRVDSKEKHSVYNVPSGNWGQPQRLDYVDPYSRTSHSSPASGFWGDCCRMPPIQPYFPPMGGGFPPFGGGGFYPGGSSPFFPSGLPTQPYNQFSMNAHMI